MAGESYYDVIAAAIKDLSENGYDSVERIAYWSERIRRAAETQFSSVDEATKKLREALASSYKRLVDQSGVLSRHPGVSAFTIDRIKPELRAELDRRILASVNLIKLNRAEAVEQTLRRFQAWSTSIPAGGSPVVDKVKAKATIKKSITDLPYTDRRLLIDQSHKLASAISSSISVAGGALGGVWHSHWHQTNYDYREEHKERDGEFYVSRDNWAIVAGLMRKGGRPYTDEIEQTAELPFCRCYYKYVYGLGAIPEYLLTAKGKEALASARAKIQAMA